MSSINVVISTIDSLEAAHEIASRLVSDHLAACVNILPTVSSVYKWKGKIHQDQECMLILKTSTDRVDELVERMISFHPYEVPEILAIPVEKGYRGYMDWVAETTERK